MKGNNYIEEEKKASPIRIVKRTPIQMPHIDMGEIKKARKAFTKDEWITVLLRSVGLEADHFTTCEKWLQFARCSAKIAFLIDIDSCLIYNIEHVLNAVVAE